jgi:general stress protein 26
MKTTSASADPQSFHHLQGLVRDIDVAMITTVTPEGALRSRPMVTRKFDDEGVIWFFASDDSELADDLHEEQAVNVSYADTKKHRYVSVTGSAKLVRDPEKARALWDASLKTYFSRGLDDPHLTLLAVRIENAEMWDPPEGRMVPVLRGHKVARNAMAAEDSDHVKVEIRATPASG